MRARSRPTMRMAVTTPTAIRGLADRVPAAAPRSMEGDPVREVAALAATRGRAAALARVVAVPVPAALAARVARATTPAAAAAARADDDNRCGARVVAVRSID